MDPMLEPAMQAVLDILLEDATRGLNKAREFRRADINAYTVGSVQYWEHAVGVLKWAKGRVKQMRRKTALRGRKALGA